MRALPGTFPWPEVLTGRKKQLFSCRALTEIFESMYNGRPARNGAEQSKFRIRRSGENGLSSSCEVFLARIAKSGAKGFRVVTIEKMGSPSGNDQRLEQVCGFRAAKEASLRKSGLFNNTQVTCVGARVGEFANDESDHALIVIRSKERLSAISI